MECPKCGAPQDAGREECSACGIVFARWQSRAPRIPALSTPVQPEEPARRIPLPFIIVAVFFVIAGGLIWTRHQKEARARTNPDAMINDINNKEAALRSQLRDVQSRAAMTAGASNTRLPANLDESRITDLIQQCSYFSERVTVQIPKTFNGSTFNDFPAISIAAAQHLIEFDPPFDPNSPQPGQAIAVKVLSSAYSSVDFSEDASVYHFGLGRRRVEITQAQETSSGIVTVAFRWNFENKEGAALGPERNDRSGGAEIQRTPNGWAAVKIWRNSNNGPASIDCQ